MTDDELQYAVEHYQPSDEVLNKLAGVRLLAVVGPSAVGKSSIIDASVKKSPLLQKVKDVTTRPPRQDQHEDEFTFLTKEKFLDDMQKQAFVQVALMPTGYLYATLPEGYPVGKVGIMAIQAGVIANFRRLLPGLKVTFIVPSSYEIWMEWFKLRPSSEDGTVKRLQEAKSSLEFALSDQKVDFILNDEIDKATERLIQVAEGRQPDDGAQAKQLAAEQLTKLNQKR